MIEDQDIFRGQNIFLGNVAKEVSEQALSELFAPFGKVLTVTIVKDRDTGNSRGFAFVEMGSEEEATAAVASVDGILLQGLPLSANLARPKLMNSEGIHKNMRLHRRHRY